MKAHKTSTRRGSLLVEVTMATVMLMIVMTIGVKTMGFAAHERAAALRRQRALLEASNIMERLTADPFDEVTPEKARRMTLAAPASQTLAGSELSVDVSGSELAPGGIHSKRVSIRLRWHGRSGEWEAPVRLTSWIYEQRRRP